MSPPLLTPERFDERNDVRQRLPRSRLRRAEHVSSAQRVRQRRALNGCHLLKLAFSQRRLGRLTDRQMRKLSHSRQRQRVVSLAALSRLHRERVLTARRFRLGDDPFQLGDLSVDARARAETLRRLDVRFLFLPTLLHRLTTTRRAMTEGGAGTGGGPVAAGGCTFRRDAEESRRDDFRGAFEE